MCLLRIASLTGQFHLAASLNSHSETSPDHLQPQSPHQPDVVSNESSSSPRILVTAPTNQDLLDQVMLQKRRQHQVVGAAGAAAAASRASTVVAMTPSLIMRAEPTTSPPTEQVSPSQEQRQVSVSGGSSRTTSEHPSLMSSELSSQVLKQIHVYLPAT